MKMKVDRRKFMKGALGAAAGAIQSSFLASAVYQGLVNKAISNELGIVNKNYLYIQHFFGPPRWCFDMPLHPAGDVSNFMPNNLVGTRYTGGSVYDGVEYATTKVQGLDMPWMWQYNIPLAGGGTTSMANLADGLLIMRGCTTNNPAHSASAVLQYKPLGMTTSLPALAADSSNAPIGAIDINSKYFRFDSTKGKAFSRLTTGGNLLEKILEPFSNEDYAKGFINDQSSIKAQLDSTVGILDGLNKQKNDANDIINKANQDAVNLFTKDFGDYTATFNSLLAKYEDLIARAIAPGQNLVGLTDKAVGTSSTRGSTYHFHDGNVVNGDLRDIIRTDTECFLMAEQFAVAEFLFINNITSAISLGCRGLENMRINNVRKTQSFDEHKGGSMVSLMINTHYYLALSSCLYELISQYKAAGIYDDTIINIGGDFGRNPRDDGSGSDHSPEANTCTLFSGSMTGLNVIGNIKQDSQPEIGYSGTWGYQAGNGSFGALNLGHVASTVAALIGVPSPVNSAESLVERDPSTGKFNPKLGTGIIIT